MCNTYIVAIARPKKGKPESPRPGPNKTAEIQRLNILLTPFKTIALERYSGNETEALVKLGLRLHNIEAGLETLSNYQGVARLGPDGKTGLVKEPLREQLPLIDLLTDSWQENADGRFSAK